MSLTTILVAGLLSGLVSINTGYLIVGFLFQPLPLQSSSLWRAAPKPRPYLLSVPVTLLYCLGIALLYTLSRGLPGMVTLGWLQQGTAFGALCWAAFLAPGTLSKAVFLKLKTDFVLGTLLNDLITCLIAGTVTAWLLSL